jgi:hypothetical protein
MQLAQRSVVSFVLATVAAGCDFKENAPLRRAPTRLEVERETVIVNGSRAVRLPVRLVDAVGAELPIEQESLTVEGDSTVQVDRGKIACSGRGDAQVSVAVGALTGRLLIRCRPVIAFGFPPPLELALGGPPQAVHVNALTASREHETLLAFDLRTADTNVIAIRDGVVHPVAVGRATVIVDFGGIATAVTAGVHEAIADDSLRLAPGEFRTWPLGPGRYEITVVPLEAPAQLESLAMETEGASCVRDIRSEDLIHCLIRSRGGIGVRNQAATASAVRVNALVRVWRIQ